MRNKKEVRKGRGLLQLVVVFLMFLLTAATANAQQTTGAPCATSATTTVDGKYMPSPPPEFGGVINLSATDSKPCWPAKVVPPKGAPNVLLIMTDDQGYGVTSTFAFKWTKQVASFFGGTRQGMVMSWPGHIITAEVEVPPGGAEGMLNTHTRRPLRWLRTLYAEG